MDTDVGLYPPRLLITTASSDSAFTSTSPAIHVKGLDRKCGFNLRIPDSSKATSATATKAAAAWDKGGGRGLKGERVKGRMFLNCFSGADDATTGHSTGVHASASKVSIIISTLL